MLLYATNSGDSKLTKGSLITFNQTPNTIIIPAQPTSVTASKRYAIFWHNYQSVFSPGTPAPGLYVYEFASQTLNTRNTDTKYISFKFYPDEGLSYGFGLEYNSMNLSLIDTNTFDKQQSIPLSKNNPNQTPIAIAVNQWGNRIFAVSYDSQENHSFSAINCDVKDAKQFPIIAELPLFTITNASKTMICSTSDGSKIFIVNSATKSIYVIVEKGGVYTLSQSAVLLDSTPVAMTISTDDNFLYIWMNDFMQNGFAKFDIVNNNVKNYMLLNSKIIANITSITISPDNKILYLVNVDSGVWMFETQSMQYIGNLDLTPEERYPTGIALARMAQIYISLMLWEIQALGDLV